ncbi:urea transporter [Acinetobacter silvestris]|uniref:Urea transporter n=1 Tax=Acinetobacter silvestris TaxID=1977882 RepID=A0A1Y3CEP8_9GAMM|nr:urea transporter [Acinetobacter silvestris]OTG65557.1 urea transporter [Acinetobacter silvestris]
MKLAHFRAFESLSQHFSSTGLLIKDPSHQQSSFLIFIDAVLRGVGQVMLQNNSYTGLLFLAGIFYNSIVLGCAALLGSIVSTGTAQLLGVERTSIQAGLFGFNGVLVAIALLYFLEPTGLTWGYVVLATASSTVIMAAMLSVLKTWNLPTLTAPFVLTTLLFILACARFGQLHSTGVLPTAGLPKAAASIEGVVTLSTLIEGLFTGIAQVFFQGNLITGLFFIIGLLISSRVVCIAALLGSLLGALVAWGMGAAEPAIRAGAFGFNSVLTAIVFGGGIFIMNKSTAVYGILAVIVTAVVFAALSATLEPLGMPALTSAFILVVWLFVLAAPYFSNIHLVQPSDQ